MRPSGCPAQAEKRRHRAMRLLEMGKTLPVVARLVGALVSSVFRWQQAYER